LAQPKPDVTRIGTEHFGFTTERVIAAAKQAIARRG
jgi:hypothetical protein